MALLAFMVTTAMAQITTSGLSGSVTASGEDVIGATIEAVHVPSGTRYKAVTNIDGMFTINGMRVGGPYEVKISYIGYKTKVVKNVTLQLGETYNLKETLDEDAKQLGEVVVVAKGSKFSVEKTGASTNISNAQIANMPTVSRSITDITRLSPYGGNGMSFAGADGRTANFTVDGANFNNNFGLSSKLPGGGAPISLDAIEEMQVVISPYDVRQTNFVGGGVNAITKSGTNNFKGSAYVYHKNENMRGDAIEREQISGAREKDQQTTWGFSLGGPIIKNKLFFFANGEMVKTPTVVNRWRGSEDGIGDAVNYISRTKLADLERVSNFVRISMVTIQVHGPTSLQTRATTSSSSVLTGTSQTSITWLYVTTIPRTVLGRLLTHHLWMVVHVHLVAVCLSTLCHLPTVCMPMTTSSTLGLLT